MAWPCLAVDFFRIVLPALDLPLHLINIYTTTEKCVKLIKHFIGLYHINSSVQCPKFGHPVQSSDIYHLS